MGVIVEAPALPLPFGSAGHLADAVRGGASRIVVAFGPVVLPLQRLASGPALPVPRLAVGCLEPFLPSNTYSGAFELARNLLLAGVGQPEDWERSKGDPVAFMLRTVERTAAAFNRKAIDAVAHTDILFGTSPYISSWHEKEYEDPGRVFLAVEATHISIVYLRPTLELLGKAHPRLPATFYRMLLEGDGVLDPLLRRVRLRGFLRVEHGVVCRGQGER